VRGVQPQEPPDDADELDELDELIADLLPLAGAAKTESCIVCFPLSHFGHVIFWRWLITMRS
jgi:hypothetical protein